MTNARRHLPLRRAIVIGLLAVPAVCGITSAQVISGTAVQTELIRHTMESDGHPMAVWEKTPREPLGTIVLLHGRTWSALPDFDLHAPGEDLSLMDGLVARGYRTFALDLRGYGSTPRDETGWLTPDRAAEDLANVLEWVWERDGRKVRPVLLGWSLGSMVSQLVVQRHADLVSAVVLFGYPFMPGSDVPRSDDPVEPPRQTNTAEAAASDFITEGSISQAAIDAYVRAALAADPVRVDWGQRHEWMGLDPALVRVPTLLLHGEFDPFARTDAQVALFTQLGTSDREWIVIPGGDHAAFLESPRSYFIDAVIGFIQRPR